MTGKFMSEKMQEEEDGGGRCEPPATFPVSAGVHQCCKETPHEVCCRQ